MTTGASEDPPTGRRPEPEVLARLVQRREAMLDAARTTGERDPVRGHTLVAEATQAVDAVVRDLVAHAVQQNPEAAAIEVVALGGYGRAELCPYSDVDLLFLLPDDVPEAAPAFVESVLYGLWDLGFEVGHAARTREQSVAVAANDSSVFTSLLDARLIVAGAGNSRTLFDGLNEQITHELSRDSVATEFINNKLQEAYARRERFGASLYRLEPNIKDGQGGLREIHLALWVARARWGIRTVRDLVRRGELSSNEGEQLERANGFMLLLRTALHLEARRRQDNLRFEYQEAIAARLGYRKATDSEDDRRRHGVERLMRAFYFNARSLESHAARVVERATSHRRRRRSVTSRSAPGDFKIWDGRITVTDRQQFQKDPSALMRIFRVAQEEAREIYSYTKTRVAEDRSLIDYEQRRSSRVVQEFLRFLEHPRSDGTMMFELHDLGLLRALIPEIRRVTARWQHSLYHVYTVDIHSIVVFKNLKRLRTGAYADEQPTMTRLMAGLPRPYVLYLAGLLHDVGKGWRSGDHSVRGAKVAEVVGRRFEAARLAMWTEVETADLVWLVREHLTMSDISQRRDLADRELVEGFARQSATVERLSMLYLLTFADMLGTSPKVWNDWKASLLRQLYEGTRSVLEHLQGGAVQVRRHFDTRRERAVEELLEAAERAGGRISRELAASFAEAMPERYMVSFTAKHMVRHAEMWRAVSRVGGLAVHVRHLRREKTTKLTVVTPDRPGLLALLAGCIAAERLQIVSAQVFSLDTLEDASHLPDDAPVDVTYDLTEGAGPRRGRAALDVLYVADERMQLCDDPERWRRVKDLLSRAVAGDADVDALMDSKKSSSLEIDRARPQVKTEILVSNRQSRRETVFDIFGPDRLGALYTIARTFADEGLSISLAKISTQGDRLADGFYVTDVETQEKITDPEELARVKAALTKALNADELPRPPVRT